MTVNERVALYPGSFDPVTFGHLDILQRAMLIFDRVVVAVAVDSAKASLFTVEERVALIRESVSEIDYAVDVTTFSGLTVEQAKSQGAIAIVRGLRALSDFEAEFQMALMNRRLAPSVHTVFLMTSFSNVFVSSSLVKEVCRHGGKIDELVPAPCATALRRKFAVVDV